MTEKYPGEATFSEIELISSPGSGRRLIEQPHRAADVDVRLDERHRLHRADLLDARQRPRPSSTTRSWKLRSAGPTRIAIPREHLQDHHALLAETGVDVQQVDEAAEQQAGARDEHQRQRHFGGDEHRAAGAAARRQRSSSGDRAPASRARQPHRRHEPRGRRDRNRQQRREAAARRSRRAACRSTSLRAAPSSSRPRIAPAASATPASDATEASNQRLDQQLPDHAAAAGAERGPDRQLLLARRAARQQQVGDVYARDQQHGEHRGGEQPDRRRGRRRPGARAS